MASTRGRNFWPTFVIVASLSAAAVWKFSPAIGDRLSLGARRFVCQLVAVCTFRPVPQFNDGPAQPVVISEAEAAERAQAAEVERSFAAAAAVPSVGAGTAAPVGASAAVKAPTAPAVDPDDLPSLKGVVQADPGTAAWGVLNRETEVEGLDGESMGRVAGGRFFVIASRTRTARGLMLIGNFTPTPLDEEVRIPAENLYCFSGSPDNLSKRQCQCLRMYYQLTGEARALKNRLMVAASEKSPYFKEAAEAVQLFQEKARQVERIHDPTSEEARQATYDLAGLRERVTELNRKHKEWKELHAFELPDPEKDPAYLKILERRRSYAGPIAGMAY